MTRYKQEARTQEAFWKLVMSGAFSYSEVAAMGPDEFFEAVAAMELYMQQIPKQPSAKAKRRKGVTSWL